MTGLLLTALFLATALLIAGALRATWRDHGAQALAARGNARSCPAGREFRYVIREIGRPSRANVIAFPARVTARPLSPAARAAA